MEELKKSINRRKFLKLSGATSAVLALGFYIPAGAKGTEAKVFKLDDAANTLTNLNPFIQIDAGGKVTIYNHKPEMGQGVWQSIPTLIAEELNLDFEQVTVKMAIAAPAYGSMSVGGSSSVRTGWIPLRRMGAAARQMLLQAAAESWNVPVAECTTDKGIIYHKASGKQGHFGEFVDAASKLEAPKEPALKPKSECRLIGKKVMRPDVVEKVDGSAIFGIDVKVEGMLYATVSHPTVLGAKINSIDDIEALKVQGVKEVFEIERTIFGNKMPTVAIVGESYYGVLQAQKRLKIDWDLGANAQFDTAKMYQEMNALKDTEGAIHTNNGDVDAALNNASSTLERVYETPFLAHSPMEPMNITIHIKEGECEIWAPTQVSNRAQQEAATFLNIPLEKVTLHTTYLGGGFGRRLFTDFLSEGLAIAQKVNKPIKLIWTREEDTTAGPFRPGMVYSSRAAFDANGKVNAWEEKVIGPSISFNINPNANTSNVDRGAMECISDSHYEIYNFRTHFVHHPAPVALGWWRSVYASTNVFGHECFVDELAEKEGMDPMDFRIQRLSKEPRFVKVLEKVREMSNWDSPLPAGVGRGVAVARSFGSTCAHVVQVSKGDNGRYKIDKIWTALDCGQYVNPDTVKGQTEGNIVMALTAAMKDPITFKNGWAEQSNFHNYKMLRINECPPLDIHIMENEEAPGGVGEPGFPPLAPALVNALYSVSGKRIYKLPFKIEEV